MDTATRKISWTHGEHDFSQISHNSHSDLQISWRHIILHGTCGYEVGFSALSLCHAALQKRLLWTWCRCA